MFKNYFRTAVKNLWRNKAYSLINVAGLSVGLACCILIFLYAKDEMSYDRFQVNGTRLYHLGAELTGSDGKTNKFSSTGMMPGPSFKRQVPGIEDFVRIQHTQFTVKSGQEVFDQDAFFVDDNFFSVFSFPLLQGDPATALKDIHSLVLSEDMARKYFGTANAEGKLLDLKVNDTFRTFKVAAVTRNSPQNSSVKIKMLLSMKFNQSIDDDTHWLNFFLNTFILVSPGSDVKVLEKKMKTVYEEDAATQLKDAAKEFGFKDKVTYTLQPFLEMHTSTDYPADNGLSDASRPVYSYILSAIALFILVIACINFVNLTVARSLQRAKEIGVRKVVGGQRWQLVIQFLGESFLLSFIAFLMAIVLVQAALPFFNKLSDKALRFSYLFDLKLVAGFIVIFLMTGLLAGFYPALVLSGFNPVNSLYGRQRFTGKNYLSKGLVILQFTLATFLIIATVTIYAQFNFLMHYDLGYNDQNVVIVNTGRIQDNKFDVFKQELEKNSGVVGVTADQGGRQGTIAHINNAQEIQFDIKHIDENYLPLLQIPVIKGRNFSSSMVSDSAESVLVNQTFVREAGWKNPIGQIVDFFYRNKKYKVIGVVKDYHFISLAEKLTPELFTMNPQMIFRDIFIKIKPDNIPATLHAIEKSFNRTLPFQPYSYVFANERNAENYQSEAKWKQMILSGSIITIFISCIGLFGLAALSAEKRKKEIGIRKILGASVQAIVQKLSNDFLKLVLVAALIAAPIAWWAMHQWLEHYPYRISLSSWIFLLAVALVLGIALGTVSYQSIRAAIANPVKSLRTE